MNDMQHPGSQLKGWINSFLKRRGRTTPSGQPLYTYATKDTELELLGAALAVNPEERHNPVSGVYWAAGYCLFVSEKYRREYDANWSWQAFDTELGIRLNPDEHKELVRKGLAYWKRPVRERAYGADYLGSLFAEGGLPWKLLQTERHGFGRAIKAALRHYHGCKRDGRDLALVIREFGQYFPQSFQTDEKYQLLARVAETLMLLAETHNLGQQDDPATYLNTHYPQWRQEFPLPLGEANGYRLVNEWLRDAGVRLEERRRAEEAARHFTCEHRLDGSPDQARLLAEVRLPRSLKVKLGEHRISTTRVELALYEGDRMARNLGVAYGRLENDELAIRLPAEVVTCHRKFPEKSLVLECSCAGERLDIRNIQSSEVDWNQLPAVFVETEDEIRLAGVASVNTRAPEVLVRVPAGMTIREARPLTTDVDNGTWYRVNDTTVIEDRGSRYVIVPGNTASAARVEFQGTLALYDTLPLSTWRGWPDCRLIESGGESRKPAAYRVDGQIVQGTEALPQAGCFRLDVLGQDGQVLARRKLGILPRDLLITSIPASSRVPARILVRTAQPLRISVLNEELSSRIYRSEASTVVELMPAGQKPERVYLEVSDACSHHGGVTIRLPYPEEGVQVVDADGSLWQGRDLVLNRILGMTLIMSSLSERPQSFHLSLELMGQRNGLEKRYVYQARNGSVQVNLHSLHDDILSLLSCSPDQDAVVRCRIETSRLLRLFDIHRYEAEVQFNPDSSDGFGLVDLSGNLLSDTTEGIRVMAMQVHTPEAASVELYPKILQDSTATGIYELPSRLQKNGPWLIYPGKGSSVFFRPALYIPETDPVPATDEAVIKTLNSAARHYHPGKRPDVFTIVLDEMAENGLHNSWLYMIELKTRYSHMPLSAFESWKHLSRHPQALALAVFRLEMDAHFAERMQQELAVIWESITLEQWQTAVQVHIHGLTQLLGSQPELIQDSVRRRMEHLSVQIPLFRNLSDRVLGDDTEGSGNLPLQLFLSSWLDDLRKHQADAQWPVNLSEPLDCWIRQHEQFSWMLSLEMPGYMRPVCCMPLFAACLTAGVARLSDLGADDMSVRFGFRVLSDFDRDGWYEPVYSAALSWLLHAGRKLS